MRHFHWLVVRAVGKFDQLTLPSGRKRRHGFGVGPKRKIVRCHVDDHGDQNTKRPDPEKWAVMDGALPSWRAGVAVAIWIGAAVLLELRIIHEGVGKLYGQRSLGKVTGILTARN